MTENKARRPPVAPKPSFIQHDASTLKLSPAPSPAVRGASRAFVPGSVKAPNPSSHNPTAGALLAATLAAGKKQQQSQHDGGHNARLNVPAKQEPPPSPRGRLPTAIKIPVAAANLSSAPPTQPNLRPHIPRSTSAVAAVAASATASARRSPRRPEITRNPTSQYLTTPEISQETRGRSSSISSSSDTFYSLSRSPDALAGAVASMNPTVQTQGAVEDRPKHDLGSVPRLSLRSSHTSLSSSPPSSGTIAAVTASRNAAIAEAKKRAQSESDEADLNGHGPFDMEHSARQILGSTWPRVRVTPPQTDSENATFRMRRDPSRKPLPAPAPLRPSQAAIFAQEHAASSSHDAPMLDVRARMSASSLADAMVASSIAAQHTGSRIGSHSRVASPSTGFSPPIPLRRSRSVGVSEAPKHKLHFPGLRSETPPPPPELRPLRVRPLRHTMRNQSPEEEEEHDKRKKTHWTRHPNKHHEGDRKRWRDKVTERERKRYEGVWAANKGILLDLDPEASISEYSKDGVPISDFVANVVVQDIWERSRLPRDVLEEVWDLVARPGAKALNREEFVAGLWLIDQRLKGRKLPVKVSPSVWASIRHPAGVKISSKALQR
ncbi:Increased rDNA silencing protein [Elasticomyces elasticus]|uniref:Increased rDNA silencing protein n=1 Tax=Exophiala sideris TaxID=1016849 RepID=A0ABR0JIN4_9EURO|nr:Increased rDNA silencing protein [Elasticomyces elasticus]KAK5034466.1 Increased rDNA silencing protein [Exophiala sideris]KAK5042763.1 Increased rDNA silencing protein [Exophiala sideris]KAK5065846.1 Increased rDNA silencing protein [Exophiala sideris]KAK5185693.1 Increased rDNA silencing protein [Eurotiomycetes sp. CCFEE 6388]